MTDAVCPACMHAVSAICLCATVLFYSSLSLISDNARPGNTLVKPSANINFVHIQSISISSASTASLTLRCLTRMCLERSVETGFVASRLALLSSPPHSVGINALKLRSVHSCFNHINSLAAELIAISSASVVPPAITARLFYLQNTWVPIHHEHIARNTLQTEGIGKVSI